MTPTSRDELIELMARAIWREKLQGYDVCGQSDVCRAWPCACAIGLVKVALTALEQSGCCVAPVKATRDMNIAMLRYTFAEPPEKPGYWTVALSANPFRSK